MKYVILLALIIFYVPTTVYAKGRSIMYGSSPYDIYVVSPQNSGIRLYWKDKQGKRIASFSRLKKMLAKDNKNLLFATNAGIFEVDYTPLGLHVEDRVKLSPLNRKNGRGNFYVKPNGIFAKYKSKFYIFSSHKVAKRRFDFATQSGPLLVYNNRINRIFRSKSDSLKIRSGVGINRQGQAIFAISNRPVNFYTFARLFKHKLKCRQALYLDGSISAMYLPNIGRHQLEGDFVGIIGVAESTK